MRALLVLGVVLLAMSAAVVAQARRLDIDAGEMPRRYPAAMSRLLAELPPSARRTPWIVQFRGPRDTLHSIDFAGQPRLFAAVCRPHDCNESNISILFTADGRRVVAHLQRHAFPELWLGAPTARERACLAAEHVEATANDSC